MSFEDRVAAVGIATQFQEHSNEVFQMMEEETDLAKTQVTISQGRKLMCCKWLKGSVSAKDWAPVV